MNITRFNEFMRISPKPIDNRSTLWYLVNVKREKQNGSKGMNKPQIGSVSSGTMREVDLIPDFIDELKYRGAKRLAAKYQREWLAMLDDDGDLKPECQEDASWLLNEDLFEKLNEDLPPYVYFGSHPGDGADYGYWVDIDAAQEQANDDGCRLEVNDHGNATLFYRNGKVAWAIV
jgi:hypothetical protein